MQSIFDLCSFSLTVYFHYPTSLTFSISKLYIFDVVTKCVKEDLVVVSLSIDFSCSYWHEGKKRNRLLSILEEIERNERLEAHLCIKNRIRTDGILSGIEGRIRLCKLDFDRWFVKERFTYFR